MLTDGGKIKDHYAPTEGKKEKEKSFQGNKTEVLNLGWGRGLQEGEILARLGPEEDGATKLNRAGEIRFSACAFPAENGPDQGSSRRWLEYICL